MAGVKKLKLIDEDLLFKLLHTRPAPLLPQEPANPLLAEIAHIDRSLDATLQNKKNTEAHVTQSQVGQLLNNHENLLENYENQKGPTPQPLPPIEGDAWYGKTVQSAPQRVQRSVSALLKHIKESGVLGWDQEGRLLVDGNIIPDSNITDLTHVVARKRQVKHVPKGVDDFVSNLLRLNTPAELVPNLESVVRFVSQHPRLPLAPPSLISPEPVARRKSYSSRSVSSSGSSTRGAKGPASKKSRSRSRSRSSSTSTTGSGGSRRSRSRKRRSSDYYDTYEMTFR